MQTHRFCDRVPDNMSHMPGQRHARKGGLAHRASFGPLFSRPPSTERVRHPTDIVSVVVGVVLLGLVWLSEAAGLDVGDGISGVGPTARAALLVLPALLAVWAVLLLAAAAVDPGRAVRATQALSAVAIAMVMAGGASWAGLPVAGWSEVEAGGVVVIATLGPAVAVVSALSPTLARPWRYLSRMLEGAAFIACAILTSFGVDAVVAAMLIGIVAAAITHLLLGSPVGNPDLGVVQRALAGLGIDGDAVAIADQSRPGATAVIIRRSDGAERLVQLFLRDSWDSQAVIIFWRSLRSRAVRPRFPRGRLAEADHEAAVSLVAAAAGAPVVQVLGVASSATGDTALISPPGGRALAVLGPEDVHDLMPRAWNALDLFHECGMVHGAIDLRAVVVDAGGDVLLTSFREAAYRDDPTQRQIDRARLLISLALRVGPRAAVDYARLHMGAGALHDLGGYVQSAILDADDARALSRADWTAADLRRRMGVDDTGGVRLALVDRQAATSFVVGGLLLFGVYALVTGVDFVAVFRELGNAELGVLAAALVVSLAIPLFFGMSTVGACSSRIPYWPSVVLQNGIQAASLAMPGSAARAALSITYFRRFGLGPVRAVSVGAIDTIAGFLVQVALLLVIIGFGLATLGSGVDVFGGVGGGQHSALLTVTVLFVALMGIALVYAVVSAKGSELARRLVTGARVAIRGAWEQLRAAAGILSQPKKILLLFLGNIGAQLVQAVVLLMVLHAFGGSAPFIQIALINTVVSLFAGIAPVPGGIGVAEAGYTACLIAAGVDATTAASVALVFRFITYYLPPAWGAVSLRWLRGHGYL